MSIGKREQKKRQPHPLFTSVLLLLMAVAAVTAATMAWLSIADNTKVRSMSMDVTSGVSLRFDLNPHDKFGDYVKTLNFSQIAARIASDYGYSMQDTPLKPVTTSDYNSYVDEYGEAVEQNTGDYLTFTLNFMATRDMIVHLTSAGSRGQDGTAIASGITGLPEAMRISFTTDGNTWVYDPGLGAASQAVNGARIFGLPASQAMVYNADNAMFSLKKDENKSVVVHVWMEGTDEACNDDLKGADYSVTLRFEGTDENHQLFEETREEEKVSETEE